MKDILINNARVFVDGGFVNSNLLIRNGLIEKIASEIDVDDNVKIIDAEGSYLLPGFIDIHTHLDDRIGNYYLADDYSTGSKIALLNGITTLYSFVTQQEGKTISDGIEDAIQKAEGKSYSNIGWHLTPTSFEQDDVSDIRKWIEKGFGTIKLYTTYKDAGIYCNYRQIRKIAEIFKDDNIKILVHCEDEAELRRVKDEGLSKSNPYSHSILRSKTSEVKAVEKIIEIAKDTGAQFHIVHVSTPAAVELICAAKSSAQITSETGPQYLFLNSSNFHDIGGYKYLCTPPLRDEKTRQDLQQLALAGNIDIYATDHCAFTKSDKSENRDNHFDVPKGIPGIGALVPMIFELYKDAGEAALTEIVKRLSENPARLINKFPQKGCIKEGADADLVLIGTSGNKRKIESSLADVYEVYPDFETDINIKAVFLKGEQMVEKNKFVYLENPKGEIL